MLVNLMGIYRVCKAVVVYALLYAVVHVESVWEEGFIEAADGVKIIVEENGEVNIFVEENYVGEIGKLLADETPIAINGYVSIDNYMLSLKVPLDFESTANNPMQILITSGTESVLFLIHYSNVNDNPTTVEITPCSCDEASQSETCSFKVTDQDGMLNKLDIFTLSEFSDTFDLQWSGTPDDSAKEAEVILSLKKELDYETKQMYNFDWTVASSDANWTPEFEVKNKIVVEVKDVADQKPRWTNAWPYNSIDEQTPIEQILTAVDGDFGLNYDITYSCSTNEKLSCKQEGSSVNVLIEPIDRDMGFDTFQFTVTACEVPPSVRADEEQDCTPLEVTMFINDINDNSPVITLLEPNLEIEENRLVSLELDISISDIDLGNFAMYDVSLSSENEKATRAINVIPDSGYQTSKFSLLIMDATLLDYEDPDMRSLTLTLTSQDPNEPSNKDSKEITITLLPRFDEFPIFTSDEYEISIEETFGRGGSEVIPIENFKVSDRDENDEITVKIIGSASNRILTIARSEDGTLTLATKETASVIFDHETQEEVLVQIEAVDKGGNRAVTQITITVLDVNDETPTISSASQTVLLSENLPNDYVIEELELTATDDDSTANLVFTILWDDSRPSKNGQRLDWETIGYLNCLEISTEKQDDSWTGKITFKDVVENNTPNYEIFDTIYLTVQVEDTAQAENGKRTVQLVINVNDINDVEPVFVIDTIKDKTVTEGNVGTFGFVSATDEDSTDLKYYLAVADETPEGLIEIGETTGQLNIVGEIDADIPIFSLEYTVTVSDGVHEVSSPLSIQVNDINDNAPLITHLEPVTVKEDVDTGTEIWRVTVTDNDRKLSNKEVTYTLTTSAEYFNIDEDGLITVKTELDRDKDDGTETIIIVATNLDGKYKDEKSLLVILEDVNDNEPKLISASFKSGEDLGLNEEIGKLAGTDIDYINATLGIKNGVITFVVSDVIDTENEVSKLTKDDFNVEPTGDQAASLRSRNSLLTKWGSYELTVTLTDGGDEPKSTTGKIPLTVAKVNYDDPEFIYPAAESTTAYLKVGQPLNQNLYLWDESEFKLVADHEESGKYIIKYEITGGTGANVFQISGNGYVQLKAEPGDEVYELDLKATDVNADEPHSSTTNLFVSFLDYSKNPSFREGEREDTAPIEEGANSKTFSFTVPQATYFEEPELEDQLEINYNIIQNIKECFDLVVSPDNKKEVTLVVIDSFTIEEAGDGVIKVLASRETQGIPNPSPDSIFTLTLNIKDINNNDPVFQGDPYNGGVFSTTKTSEKIFSVNAIDIDSSDTLKYSIEDMVCNVVGSPNVPFKMSGTDVQINFDVQPSMSGYFKFNVIVNDTEHTATAASTVFIIAEENIVQFIFENVYTDVEAKKSYIEETFEKYLHYKCVIDRITEGSATSTALTDVNTHFIEDETSPVLATVIKNLMNDVTTYSSVKADLLKEGLAFYTIYQPAPEPENKEETLKAWLIGVSVILGSIILVLLVIFVLRTRTLKKRLDKLSAVKFSSQDSLNKAGIAAPTTNRRAVEGSNPIYATDVDRKMPEFDENSISSGDSDLIGVENNSVFDN